MAETPRDVIEKLKAKLASKPDIGKDIGAMYKFVVTGEGGGTWLMDMRQTPPAITEGESAEAACTIRMDSPDFVALLNRAANPVMLYMSGKLKIEGDMPLAMKLQSILS
ncbi:MAG: SCP2 sterol-binding domain-containing protein [Syntrophales bacterium]|nr:SCP2 sterol-binding domain-containing protein [Syntrophales bacterium]MDD5234078.1 SCP2 sterol-binding domain-containing protein [Syntrophales bacterium]